MSLCLSGEKPLDWIIRRFHSLFTGGSWLVHSDEFQNNGTCAWSEDYLLTFMSGNEMNGETTEISQELAIGGTGDFSVALIAPSTDGTYTGYWRLADESGSVFGQSVYVTIVVSDDAATTTSTATSTTEPVEATSTSTATATSTATTIPTEAEAVASTEAASQ